MVLDLSSTKEITLSAITTVCERQVNGFCTFSLTFSLTFSMTFLALLVRVSNNHTSLSFWLNFRKPPMIMSVLESKAQKAGLFRHANCSLRVILCHFEVSMSPSAAKSKQSIESKSVRPSFPPIT